MNEERTVKPGDLVRSSVGLFRIVTRSLKGDGSFFCRCRSGDCLVPFSVVSTGSLSFKYEDPETGIQMWGIK